MLITMNGTLRNDQTAGIQDDDDAISSNLTGLNTTFRSFLLGLTGDLLLSPAQLAFADNVEAAISPTNLVTVAAASGENVDDLFFSNGSGGLLNGQQVFISAGVPLQTVSGSNIFLHSYEDGDIVLATTSATEGVGDVVAAFYLNESADHLSAGIETVTFTAIKHPITPNPDDAINWTDLLSVSASGTVSFDFDQLKSGSSLWVAVGNASGGLLVTGGEPDVDANFKKTNDSDVIHTSQGGQGATIGVNNQLFDVAGESAVFTLVTGLNSLGTSPDAGATGDYVIDPLPNKKPIEGIDYNGYINTTGAGIFLSQSQGNDPKNMDIFLWEAGGDAQGPDPQTAEDLGNYVGGLAVDEAVDVTSVTITDDDGNVVGTWIAGGTLESGDQVENWVSGNGTADITVSFSGNKIDVDGVLGGYTVSWTSASGDTFNRFELVAQGGQFDVGRVDVDNVTGDTEGVGGDLFVDDDGPSIGNIVNSIVDFAAGDTTGPITLNGATGTDPNSSPYRLTNWTTAATINGVTLTAIPNATGTNPVTSVAYWGDTNGVAGIQTTGANADLKFYELTLSQTDFSGAGSYTFTVFQDPPILEVNFGFADQPAAQNLFGIIATDKSNVVNGVLPDGGLLFFNDGVVLKADGTYDTNASSTVNTSKGGGQVSIGYGNQSYSAAGEDAFFVYADNPSSSAVGGLGLTQTTADDADTVRFNGTNEGSSASVEIVKIVSGSTAGVTIEAWDLNPNDDPNQLNIGDQPLESRNFLQDPLTYGDDAVHVDIDGVRVWNSVTTLNSSTLVYAQQDLNNDGDYNDAGETIDTGEVDVTINPDGTVTVLSMDSNKDYTIRFDTVAPHDLAQVLYETGSYNIGGFNVVQALDTIDQKFDFTARATDGDGDWVEDSWSVGIDGTGVNDNDAVAGVDLLQTTAFASTMAMDTQQEVAMLGMRQPISSLDHVIV